MSERLRRRLELRRSSAASPHRNRKREYPWFAEDFHDLCYGEELCDCEDEE